VDYIFIDPPFGGNLMYSEINFLWEAWLRVLTNNQPEAVVNKVQRKGLPEYQALMEACFREFYRLLKPGRWMTVEFHNSQNRVWNAIQEAILRTEFMVADVRTLDKKQGTFKQITSTAAVKQDLIISAYKPRTGFERRFLTQAGSEEGAWAFIRRHLEQLPVVVERGGGILPTQAQAGKMSASPAVLEAVAERQAYLLYDRMVAFHIQRGFSVPLGAAEFYAGLKQRFPERDGTYSCPTRPLSTTGVACRSAKWNSLPSSSPTRNRPSSGCAASWILPPAPALKPTRNSSPNSCASCTRPTTRPSPN